MEDRLIGHLGLAVGLRMSYSNEPYLAAQVAEIVREFTGVKLPTVIKTNGMRNAKVGDNVSSNEPSYFSGGCRGYGFSLYPLVKWWTTTKRYLRCPVALGKGSGIPIPHVANARGLTMGVMGEEGTHWMGENFWHLSQVRTSVMASSRRLVQ